MPQAVAGNRGKDGVPAGRRPLVPPARGARRAAFLPARGEGRALMEEAALKEGQGVMG